MRYLSDRHVGCDQSNTEAVACENHKRFRASTIFEIFGVTWEFESIALDSCFVDRRSNYGVDFASEEVGSGSFEGFEGRFACFGSRLSEFDLRLVGRSVDDADFVRVDIVGRASYADCVRINAKRFFVIACSFGRAIDDRSALFEDVLVGKGFEDYFVANAIDVALSDAYFKFFFP